MGSSDRVTQGHYQVNVKLKVKCNIDNDALCDAYALQMLSVFNHSPCL